MGVFDKLKGKKPTDAANSADMSKQPAQASNPVGPASADNTTSSGNTAGTVPSEKSAGKAAPDESSLAKAKQYIAAFASRRSIRALGKRQIIPDAEIVSLIQETVRESPTAFNSQSSRAVILLGDAHDAYWNDTVSSALRKHVADDAKFNQGKQRLDLFAKGSGTVLFFEDSATVEQWQGNVPSYAEHFPTWSTHGTGMAQINTWVVLELAGFGATLQHYGNLSEKGIIEKLGLSPKWKLHAELVFGSPEGPADAKDYMNDAERFKVVGASS